MNAMEKYRCRSILVFAVVLIAKECLAQNDCPTGLYGIGCTLPCTCVSQPTDTVCDSIDGTCACQPAFAGAVCDKTDVSASMSYLQEGVYDGHSLTLLCQTNIPLQDVNNYRVEFTLPNSDVVFGNLQVVDLRDTGEYRYTVEDVSIAEHTGTYQCTVGTMVPGIGLLGVFSEIDISVQVPTPPSIIGSVRAASSSALLAEWIILSNSGDPEMTSCTVQYKLASQPQADAYTTSASNLAITDTTRHLVMGLEAYTEYDVRYYCVNDFGTSSIVEVATKTGVTYPESPFRVTVEDISYSSATIRWFEPFVRNGPLSFYRIVLTDEMGLTVYDTSNSESSLVIDDLVPETTYRVEVNAINEDSTGQFAGPAQEETVTFETLTFPPSPPTQVSATNGDAECLVEWRQPLTPNGNITHYMIYYTISSLPEDSEFENDTEDGSVQVNGNILEHNFLKEMMKPNSRYGFKLTASSIVGEGEPCECSDVYCTTKPGAPDRESIPIPAVVQSSAQTSGKPVTKTAITMRVNPVSSRNGPVTCYEVIVVPLNDIQDIAGSSPDELFPPENITYYAISQARPGHPYVALTISREMVANGTTVVIGDGSITQCNDSLSGSSRRRRETKVSARQRSAENGPLIAGVLYSTFLRVYVLVDNDTVEYASSSFMEPVRTKGANRGDVLKGTIIAVVALVLFLAILGALMVLCFQISYKTPHSEQILEHSDHTWTMDYILAKTTGDATFKKSHPMSNGISDTATIDKRVEDDEIIEIHMNTKSDVHDHASMDEVDMGEHAAVNEAYYDSDIPPDMPEIQNVMHEDHDDEFELEDYMDHNPAAIAHCSLLCLNGDVAHVNEAYYDSDIPPGMPEIQNFMHDEFELEGYMDHDPANGDEPVYEVPPVDDDESDDEGGLPDYVNVDPKNKQSPGVPVYPDINVQDYEAER